MEMQKKMQKKKLQTENLAEIRRFASSQNHRRIIGNKSASRSSSMQK